MLCFGDFNKDKKLDFLTIRYAGKCGNADTYRTHVLNVSKTSTAYLAHRHF